MEERWNKEDMLITMRVRMAVVSGTGNCVCGKVLMTHLLMSNDSGHMANP